MKRSGELDSKILKEIGKLSEIEFLGVLRFLNISIVEDTNPISQSPADSGHMTTDNIDLIDENKLLDTESKTPRAFPNLIEDLVEVIGKLNRTQKRNLYRLIREVTKKRSFKGNQNFLILDGEENKNG